MSENKVKENLDKGKVKLFGMPVYLYVSIIVVVMVGMYTEVITTDMTGSLAILLALGMLFGEIGNRIPIWNEYFGGGTLLVFIVVTIMASRGMIPEKYIESTTVFMKDSNFLTLFICILITGSILSVNRNQC